MTPEDMQERDIVEFTDDNGNTLMLEVMDYFYYNGQEFAALCNANENPGDDDPDDDAVYIMQVNTFTDEDGEEMEEFVPPEEALMEKLIQVVRTRFSDEADDEDEDDEFAESWRPAEYADMSGDWEKKKAVLDFAAEVLDIAAVVKSYYDIELNDTPVDRKVVREFKPEGFWDDFTFSSLHMLFNAFDRNLGENQVVLLSSRGIRYEAVDELAALPQSLEKRNALKLFDKGLRKMEISAIENKKRLESDTAEDFSIYHQEDYRQLVSELRWGQEVFRSLTDDVVGRLAVDINAAAVLNYVLPVYDDTAPDVSAPRSTLTGIGDYERQPGEVQKYIKGLTRRHIARVLKTHRRVLDDGDFDRGLFADIEALGKSQLTLKSIAAARRNNERALAAEETVYRRYRAFRKTHPDRAKLLANALWQGRICNN